MKCYNLLKVLLCITVFLTGCQTQQSAADIKQAGEMRNRVYEYVVDKSNSSIQDGIVRVYPVDIFGNRMYHKPQFERRGDRLYEIHPDGKIYYIGTNKQEVSK